MSNRVTVRQLIGLACPKCHDDACLNLILTTWASLSADGTQPFGDPEWDQDAPCVCKACDFSGIVADFAYTQVQS